MRNSAIPDGTPDSLQAITDALVVALRPLRFGDPVTHVYNPLEYARSTYDAYLARFGRAPKEAVLVGMNPGPWGMAQTGVPFGEVAMVGGWLGLAGPIGRPRREHPKRRVEGFECTRREVSGQRVWGWVRDRFQTPERFFARFFIHNYCPLLFLEASGRNRTPDKLTLDEREPLLAACDLALRRTVEVLQAPLVIGVGVFAEQRVRNALEGLEVAIGRILHPSPASPIANKGWAEQAEAQLAELGVEV